MNALWRVWFIAAAVLATGSCVPADFDYANGAAGRYTDWTGRWVVLNYWAEWCAPCRHEIPELNALNHVLEGRSVLVVGINYDGVQGAALPALVTKMGIEFPVIDTDPRKHYGYALPTILPTTIVIDPKGGVAATLVGPQTRASLQSLLGIMAPM
jgi:thiol-disulfide isomerase/thioredoxin